MKKLRKLLVIGVMVLSVIAMSGLVVAPASAAASTGDLIKMAGNTSVYYLGADGKRYVFPNSTTYFSWYPDFSGVVTIPAAELQSYPLGGNVTMRAGTKLVKITTDPSVYAVEPNGTLRKIQSEAQAAALYGTNWNKRVVDVPDAFFTNYTVGAALVNGATPVGSLVKNAGAASVYYYDGSNYRSVSNEAALAANRFQSANIITLTNAISVGGTAITAAESTLVNVAQNGGVGPVITGSGLMVSLSSTTPAATSIPAGSPTEFLKINLTAANDGNVNVSAITLTAYDLGVSTWIDDATFYDNGVKVGTAKNFNSDRIASFSFATPVVVNAGTTKTLTVKATIESAQTGGNFAIGIAKAADITATASAVSGSFPISGNAMSVTTSTIGTVNLTNAIGTDSSNQFGEDNVLLASFDLTANNEPILIQTIKLRNGGTDAAGIVDNLKLLVDGTEVATGTYADKYVTFSLNNYKIAKSDTVSLEVRGDMGVTNNNDTFVLYIKDKGDFVFLGQDYGFGAQLTTAGFERLDTTTEGITVTLATGQFTIDMDKSVSTGTPSKDVKAGDNDVVLATLVLKSNGENATIEQIVDNGGSDFEIQGTGLAAGEIENVEMRDTATGAVYDITATRVGDTQWTMSMTDEISLVKGVSKIFQIRADMSDTVGAVIDNGDTLKVVLDGAAMTITGDSSNAAITDVTPSSVTSATATIKAAALTWSPTSLSAQTAVGGAADVVVYKASLKAGTADGIKLSTVTISTLGADAAFADSDITKLDLYLNGNLLKSVSNGIVETAAAADAYITFNSLNTAYNTIAAGATVDLVVKASFASTITAAGVFDLEMESTDDVTSRAVSTNDAVTENADGTTISGVSGTVTTSASGNLKVELLTTDIKADEDTYLLAGSQTVADRYLAELKFTTSNEPVKVTRLRLENSGTAASDDISSVKLVKADGTVVATALAEADGDVTYDPFDYVFAADQATSLFVVVVAKGMNVEGDPSSTADYQATVIYNIDDAATGVVAKGNNSSADITMVTNPGAGVINGEWSAVGVTSKTATVVGSYMSTITNAMTDATLTGGTAKILGKYKFVFDNGSNRNTSNEELKAYLDAFKITVTKSTAVVITNVNAHIDGTATKVAGDITTLGNGNTAGSVDWLTTELQGLADGGKMDGEVTLVITGDVTTTDATSEYIQTSIADVLGAGDVDYIGNGLTAGPILTATYLPITEVVGGTLSE